MFRQGMFHQECLTDEEKQVQHLMPLYMKVREAEDKETEAVLYSDWSRSIGAYKAAHTKVSDRLYIKIKKHLGTTIDDCTGSDADKEIAVYARLQFFYSIIVSGMMPESIS
mgnify:CR=1 FL=1